MKPEELRDGLARLGLNPRQLGEAVSPPVSQPHMYAMAKGTRRIGPVMAHRLREAMVRLMLERARPAGE